jgi:DNA modification methylase
MTKEYKVDTFLDESRYNTEGYSYGMSQKVCNLALLEHTNEGDTVYDPFMGSGTTALAAIKTNRKYLGSEILQEYADIAENRIKVLDFTAKKE